MRMPSADELERAAPAAGLLGYLNYSDGRPDPRWQKQLNDAYALLAQHGSAQPWADLHAWLARRLADLQAAGSAAFRDVTQARAVLGLFPEVLAAYRRHHADLLFHQTDRDLFQPFFLARVFEALLSEGGPWEEKDRLVPGTLRRLNDFVGYRPVAILETRPRGEPYEHERVRPVPLYLRGAGVAAGRYHDLVRIALDLLANTDPMIRHEAGFEPALLDEFAFDPRAYDHGHPANRRPNYVFGEWDPDHLDDQGRFRRYVARQVLLDALLSRVERAGPPPPPTPPFPGQGGEGSVGGDRDELLFEAAAALAGTVLMAAGTTGASPTAHTSGDTLAALLPRIARYRDVFYTHLLGSLSGPHADRLRKEMESTRQPFGAVRQHLNAWLARHRAAQLQQRFLSLLFADMGYPDASRREAARIPAPSVRMLSEMLGRLSTGHLLAERGRFAEAARLLPEVEDLLRRGIACGALADPWNVLGFQGLFPLSPAREDSVRDTRIDELLHVVELLLGLYARLASEAAGAGQGELVKGLLGGMKRLAAWWDRFATYEVSDVRRVHGGEAVASAEHVSQALARWHERGEATADLAFWRQHLEGFRSPEAFARVVDALLRKHDHRAAMALLMAWLGHAEQVPLEEGEYSFHGLALRWMLDVCRPGRANFPLARKFLDFLEANAEDYWQVPELEPPPDGGERADEEESLFGAAYEGVTYRDSAADDDEGAVAGGGPREEFDLEAEGESLAGRLRFLSTAARLWQIAARAAEGNRDALEGWLATARSNLHKLLGLLDAIHAHEVPEPTGGLDSLVEFDRRRYAKEQLVHTAIATCLDTALAVGSLRGALGQAGEALAGQPEWEPDAIRLERAVFRGDAAEARRVLPEFLARFRGEPLLFTALADGGSPRPILRARIAQTILRALSAHLPRLGLLRETYQLLKAAREMEQARPPEGRGVSEFNHLFQAAFGSVVEAVVESAASWEPARREGRALVDLLETLTGPFLALWVEHSRSLQLSGLEAIRTESQLRALHDFIRTYGGDLFHARFMTLGNLRGILHRGVGAWLDHLAAEPDPLHPVRLADALEEGAVRRDEAVGLLQVVLQAAVENYEEYKDYNTTTTLSDYGENLHVLLDFLRLKASYERYAWQFRPLVLAHEVLARKGWAEAAVLWQEAFAEATHEVAARHLEELARLERQHGVRLNTVGDRLREQFVKPLAVDRLCALIGPAMAEARQPGERPSFARLEEELKAHTASPTGVGLDVPHWLRRLGEEVQRVRASQTQLAELAGDVYQLPQAVLSYEDLQRQMEDWEKPLGAE